MEIRNLWSDRNTFTSTGYMVRGDTYRFKSVCCRFFVAFFVVMVLAEAILQGRCPNRQKGGLTGRRRDIVYYQVSELSVVLCASFIIDACINEVTDLSIRQEHVPLTSNTQRDSLLALSPQIPILSRLQNDTTHKCYLILS